MLIEVKDLTKVYGELTTPVRALDGVTFDVSQGEFVAIIGASGSGKSTLMHLLGCLEQPTGGTYQLDGMMVGELDDDQLAQIRNEKIGFVLQQFNLLARTTAIENVVLPLTYGHRQKGDFVELAVRSLQSVGLGDRLNHKPNELSGGEQQRVAIARALVNDPAIIMADEPTGALDTRSSAEILGIFIELNNRGKTIIMITHEMDVAAKAKRIIRVQDGKIISDELMKKQAAQADRSKDEF